jgi:hypothetical protein
VLGDVEEFEGGGHELDSRECAVRCREDPGRRFQLRARRDMGWRLGGMGKLVCP